ncbi:hotdog fold thioesterase [Arthrobacter echini]|uniref:Hotdog fold thioesterase n=2 Tax=Arthrobacter echini TaxID=1529066 RepID=A0A4S5E9Q8_9MICC|nr:hotdog fold thioesterase [Arthrobacter echini]
MTPATSDDATPWTITLGELDEKMGVRILEQSADRVVATMPVEGNRQSFGLLHGGASLAVGEAVGSWAAVIHASTLGKTAVGVDVSATHHKGAREGLITITATPLHLGRTVTTHEVLLSNEAGQRICTLRITNLLLDRPIPTAPPTA